MGLFKRSHKAPPGVLLNFSKHDAWTVRDSFEGVQIFGGTGSGKTSGSGKHLAKVMLAKGYGGLVLSVKPEVRSQWTKYCKAAGREESLVIVGADNGKAFNFLHYEHVAGAGDGYTENLVELFMAVMEASERGRGMPGSDPFWERAARQLLRNGFDLLRLSGTRLGLAELTSIVRSAPRRVDEVKDDLWQAESYCFKLCDQAARRELNARDEHDLRETVHFLLEEFPRIPEKTRNGIVSTYTTMCDGFLRGAFRELLCDKLNIVPDIAFNGAVILIDLPTTRYQEVGRLAQIIWKLMFQRAVERRDLSKSKRPVFLWADEAQHFLLRQDAVYQQTAREKRAATVYLTQSYTNYLDKLGGENGRPAVDSLLGNLQTKIFHQGCDTVTNDWAERVFGKGWTFRSNLSSTDPRQSDENNGPSSTMGLSESYESNVPGDVFNTLRKGGPENKKCVDAIVFQGGRTWSNGKQHLKVTFNQS